MRMGLRDLRFLLLELASGWAGAPARGLETRMRRAAVRPRFNAPLVAALGALGFVSAVIGVSSGIARAALRGGE
jgi:hypothetical protein